MKKSRSLWGPAALLGLLALPACLSLTSEKDQEAAAEKAVLARHDSVMTRMDQLYLVRQQLQGAALPDTARTGRRRRALLAAEAAMMDWMHQYRQPADSVAHAQKMRYFGQQQHKIDSVAVLLAASLDSARQTLRAGGAAAQPSPTP